MGYDANDYARERGPAALRALLDAAAPPPAEPCDPAAAFAKPTHTPDLDTGPAFEPDPAPPAEEDDEETAIGKRLAALSDLDYDRIRESEAKKLRARAPTLDKLRNRFLPKSQKDDLPGSAIELLEHIPWPSPVTGPEVFNETFSAIKRHIVIPDELAVMVAMWIVHTHLYEVFNHTPRLIINAPDEACGKSTLGTHIILNMVNRPQSTENLTPAVFYRLIEAYQPTIIADEFDELMKQDNALIGGINGGYEPHGGALRCVGDNLEVRKFSTYAPVVMCGVNIIAKLPQTTISRSFVIMLERATAGDTFTPLDAQKHAPALRDIGRRIARWCADHREKIRTVRPQLPAKATNRKADKWRPLFALAETAGGDWPARALAAFEYESRDEVKSLSKELELLTNIHEVLNDNERYIFTEVLIDRLCEIDESRWVDYNYKDKDPERRKIRPKQLADLLKIYKIRPALVGSYGAQRRGYRRDDFELVWLRYLPPPDEQNARQNVKVY